MIEETLVQFGGMGVALFIMRDMYMRLDESVERMKTAVENNTAALSRMGEVIRKCSK